MGKSELALLFVVAVAAFALYNLESSKSLSKEQEMFDSWKQQYGKHYEEAGVETYTVEMNGFADLTTEEFKEKYLINMEGYQATGKCTGSQATTDNLPEEVDWETKGAVTGVKNQGQCGSCWAFSTTGSLEGAHFRSKGALASFSEQHLVDCSTSYGNQGCGGGWMNQSFFYVVDNGISLESKYPYKGVNGKCSYNSSTDKAWAITNCVEVSADKEISLKASVALNPVSVAIEANHVSFQLYKGGVYSGNCGTKLDHGVLAVGYGTTGGKKYWKVKNSWGSTWGQKGYILIENSGDGKGKCGIQMAASYPVA